MELKDKVVVITGAGRGVGRSIALALAPEGVRLALVARTESELKAVQKEAETLGGETVVIPTDLSDPKQIEDMTQKTFDAFGTVDVIINNAAWSPPLHPIQDTTLEDWDYVMAVNARAPFLVTKAFLPTLLDKQSGHVINISSVVAKKGVATASAYCMSKAAQLALGESLLAEAGPQGIRVTNLMSEPINTRMRWEATPDYPRDRVIEPENVAQVVVDALKLGGKAYIDEVPVRVL